MLYNEALIKQPFKPEIMKTTILMSAFLLSATLLSAQTGNKPATVRIKKIENINGVEKITDTTFTTTDPHSIHLDNGTIDVVGDDHDAEIIKKVIIHDGNGEVITEDIGSHEGATMKKIVIDEKDGEVLTEELQKQIDEEVEKAMKDAGVDTKSKGTKKIIVINETEAKVGDHKAEAFTKVVVVKKSDLKNADEADIKRLGKSVGENDGKLKIEKMNFYPNPNNGKFNLSFTLAEKGDTEISILNIDGKVVYKEKLANFSGNYEKEIDISKNAKGVYFIKVEQGKHSQVKKIVME